MKKLIYRALLALSLVLLASPLAGHPAARPNPPVGATKRLLVIAPSTFQPAMQAFIAYKHTLLPTAWRSLEDILRATSGVDDPEKLKRFSYAEWRERGLGYVLLVGDVDDSPLLQQGTLGDLTPNADWHPLSIFFQGMKFMVFGDPSLRLPVNRP